MLLYHLIKLLHMLVIQNHSGFVQSCSAFHWLWFGWVGYTDYNNRTL